MSVQKYSERINKLISINYKKEMREQEITKKSIIFHEKLGKLQKSIVMNRVRLEAASKGNAKMEDNNLKLRKFIAIEAEEVASQKKQNNEKLENAIDENETLLLKSREIMLKQMEKLCLLKMLTGILLKTANQSPNAIDGVIQGNASDNANWTPIHIDLSKHSADVIQSNTWQILMAGHVESNAFDLLELKYKESLIR